MESKGRRWVINPVAFLYFGQLFFPRKAYHADAIHSDDSPFMPILLNDLIS